MNHLLQFRIHEVIPETNDANTFILKEINGNNPVYRAGQFLTFIFRSGEKEIRRSYSFSSTPGIDPYIAITLKRIPNGEVSRHLIDHMKTGDTITALPPAGMFVLDKTDNKQRDIFLLAAGSGITPVFSLLKDILHTITQVHVTLIYQNHSKADTIFRKELEVLAARFHGSFKWIDMTLPRLNNEELEKLIPQHLRFSPEDALFFICGPLSFMRMCQFTLMVMGFSENQIRKEFFVTEPPPPPPLIKDALPRTITLHNEETKQFISRYPKTILESALEQNIALPYSCRSGRCASCVARCVKGEVVMSINEVLTEKDLQQGLVLTCVGYAATDVELSYD